MNQGHNEKKRYLGQTFCFISSNNILEEPDSKTRFRCMRTSKNKCIRNYQMRNVDELMELVG